MRSRPGITLLEVLVTIFIMGIGLLALLALFPLGAVNMGRALRDDRATSAAIVAENLALARNVRQDSSVVGAFTAGPPALPPSWSGPSYPVLVDPFFPGSTPLGMRTGVMGITRTPTSFASPGPTAARWFSLPDDISFNPNGTPDQSSGFINRGGDYTWTYLLRRPRANSPEVVDLSIIVYHRRPLDLLEGESAYAATGARGGTEITLTWGAADRVPPIRIGRWLLDTSPVTFTDPVTGQPQTLPHAQFYRVVDYTDPNGNTMQVEVQQPLKETIPATTGTVVTLEYAVEIFHKGVDRNQ